MCYVNAIKGNVRAISDLFVCLFHQEFLAKISPEFQSLFVKLCHSHIIYSILFKWEQIQIFYFRVDNMCFTYTFSHSVFPLALVPFLSALRIRIDNGCL